MATFRNLIHNAWRGIKDIFDFKVPEEVVRVRETKWDDFFERYSKETSDEIDLNVDILEPEEEEEEEEEESEEDHSFGQRLPMRTPTSLIQYWINTGNPPCKALLDKNALSDSGSSLSEKELSLLPNAKNENNRQKSKTDSSCSSVDTAVYILSNANVTKKADTIAIIAGAENVNSKLTENSSVEDVETISNSKTRYIKSAVNHAVHSDRNIDISNSNFCSLSTLIASTRLHDQLCSSINTKDSSDLQSKRNLSCKNSDEIEVPSQKSASTDDTERSITQCINKTSVSVANYKTSDGLAPNEVLDSLRKEQTNVTNKGESPLSHRKKLYTGRDSPIDLLQTKVHSISRLSNVTDVLHPALDPNDIDKKKISKKSRSFFNEHFLKSVASQRSAEPGKKKVKRKRSSVKNIADSDRKVMRLNKIQDSVTDGSSKYPSESHNSDKHDSVQSSQKYNDTNVSTEEITSKPDLASVNLNPVVVLTRLGLCNSNESSKQVGNNARKSVNDKHSRKTERKTEKPYARGVEDLDVETIESDDNTILICECKKTSVSQNTLFSNNCSEKSRVSNKIVIEQKTASKKVRSSNLRGETELGELRVVLERLSPSVLRKYTMKKSKVSRKDTVWQKEALKLPEVKVKLERLPANMCRNRGDNIAEEKILSDSSSPRDNKRKSRQNRVPTCGNAPKVVRAREVTDDQSGKLEENETTQATNGIVVDKHVNRLFDNAESSSALRFKTNDTRTSRNKRRKYSILSSSSDETSLNEPIQPSKKQSKILGKTNEKSSRDKIVFDVFDSKRNTRKDKRVHFSTSESNTSSPKVNENRKRSFFISTDTTNSVSSDTSERDGMRCKDDVGIVLFQTKTYETDSSDTEIYNPPVRKRFDNRRIWKDSSSLSSSGEKQHAASGTCNREISSSSGEEDSHDDFNITDTSEVQSASTPKKTSSDKENDLVSRRKEQLDRFENAKISQRNNSVESTETKLITFQTKTYYDSDSSV